MKSSDFNVGEDGGIGNFIDDIAQHARESNGFVLEVGVGKGTGSTVAIQKGLEGHKKPLHISVDRDDYMVTRPTVKWWIYVRGDSRSMETLATVKMFSGKRKAGLIFIDTDHTYEQMQAELPVWANLADKHTVWLFHDTRMHGQYNEGMCRAIVEFAQENDWVFEEYKTEPHGLGKMKKAQ